MCLGKRVKAYFCLFSSKNIFEIHLKLWMIILGFYSNTMNFIQFASESLIVLAIDFEFEQILKILFMLPLRNVNYLEIRNWIAASSPGMSSIRSLEIMTNDFADFLILYTKKLKDFHEICTIIDISIFFRNVLKKGYYENGEKEGLTLLRSVQAYFSLFTCCGVVLQRHIWSLIILLTAIKKAFPAQSN